MLRNMLKYMLDLNKRVECNLYMFLTLKLIDNSIQFYNDKKIIA